MKEYQSIKKVKAEQMDYYTANKLGLLRDYDPILKNHKGYMVVYEDGYKSWSPSGAFEAGYIEIVASANEGVSE